jgi:sugar phosphate isomerase/epimerase
MLQLKKALNLQSLRLPLKSAIATAAAIGADAIELNGRTQIRPAEMTRTAIRHFQKTLADFNLKVASIHFPTRRGYATTESLEQRIDATKAAMTMAYQLGCNIVVNQIGLIPETDTESWNILTQALSDIGNHGNRCGAKLAAQTGVDSGEKLGDLIDRLPVGSLQVDFDPAGLMFHNHNIGDAMKVLASHVAHVRARDATEDLSQGKRIEVQLGRGSVDWAQLLGLLEEKNYAGYLTVERDAESDAVVQCEQSLQYLTQLFS